MTKRNSTEPCICCGDAIPTPPHPELPHCQLCLKCWSNCLAPFPAADCPKRKSNLVHAHTEEHCK